MLPRRVALFSGILPEWYEFVPGLLRHAKVPFLLRKDQNLSHFIVAGLDVYGNPFANVFIGFHFGADRAFVQFFAALACFFAARTRVRPQKNLRCYLSSPIYSSSSSK